jgi:class 3 adenylate cyclase
VHGVHVRRCYVARAAAGTAQPEAVACAIDIQRALAQRAASGELPLQVRMGIHTGEAIERDGDFYGRSVILAARIADRAHGAEILVSSLVKDLIEPSGDIPLGMPGRSA